MLLGGSASILPRDAPALPPAQLLAVMGLLLNSLAVEVVKGPSAAAADAASPAPKARAEVSRHMSDAALQGFCHLHHLLLAVALEPGSRLMQQAAADVVAFIDVPSARHKDKCPDLGRLLVSFLLVPEELAPWSEFAPVFVRELLSREVRLASVTALEAGVGGWHC